MRLRLIIAFILVLVALSSVLHVQAQATNFVVGVGCDAISISGTAGAAGSLIVNVTAGATPVIVNNTTTVASGQVFNFVLTFAPQPIGTNITIVTTLGTFVDNRTVACAGSLSGPGDGRLNVDAVAGPIAVFCSNGGVSIVEIVRGQGAGGVNANGGQIASGLALAGTTRQNVQIVGSGATSLWALSSGELQAVFRGGSNYDFVFSPSRCGITFTLTGVIVVTATPIGTPVYLPPVYGPGIGVVPPVNTGACVAPTGARAAHIVRSGENLFRIGLRYGVDFRIIAAYNGISDPARIFAGQCIIIP